RTAHLSALADVAVAPDDSAVDRGAGLDYARVADDCGAAYDSTVLDLDACAEVNRSSELGVAVYLDLVLDPDAGAWLCLFALVGKVNLALEIVGGGDHVVGDGANVAPVAVGHVAEHRVALFEQDREKLVGEVKRLVGFVVAED